MEVKTGHLRNHLSRYLKRVRQTGETIVVLDRNEPVAEIRPYSKAEAATPQDIWTRRAHFMARAGAIEEDLPLPERRTAAHKDRNPLD